jgi:hypothetical protein
MAYTSNLKKWGASGDERTEYPDGYSYKKDHPPITDYDNFVIHNVIEDLQHLIDVLNTIDAAEDGTVPNAETVQGLEPSQLGGFNYVQTDRATASSTGETWFHTSSNLLRIWNGSEWGTQPVVRKYSNNPAPADEYETTHESPYPHTQRYNGHIELIEALTFADFEDGFQPSVESRGDDVNLDRWSQWTGDTTKFTRDRAGAIYDTFSGKLVADNNVNSVSTVHEYGIKQYFEFTVKLGRDTLSINDTTEFTAFNDNNSQIAKITFHDGAGNVEITGATTEELMAGWSAGNAYTFLFEWDFANDTFDISINGGTPTTHNMRNASSKFAKFETTNSTTSSQELRAVYIDELTQGPHMSGEAVLNFTQPEFISQWGHAVFNALDNGGSVSVNLENENDGTLLVGDYIPEINLSESISPSINPQLRIYFTRDDYTDTPEFDGFDIQWTLDGDREGEWIAEKAESAKRSALVANLII